MTFIADGLLLLAAIVAAVYCRMLAIRLRALANMDVGVGGAISTLSEQVNTLKETLAAVSARTDARAEDIMALTEKADGAARRLELLLASLHEPDPEYCEKTSAGDSLKLTPSDQVLVGNRREKITQTVEMINIKQKKHMMRGPLS